VSKYLIAVFFLISITQEKSEALDLDGMVMIKEVVEISNKYKQCTGIKDDKRRLACFDSLTNYIKEREKKYNKLLDIKEKDRLKLIDSIDSLVNKKRVKR